MASTYSGRINHVRMAMLGAIMKFFFFYFKNCENKKFIHNFYFDFQHVQFVLHDAILNRGGSWDRKKRKKKKEKKIITPFI